MIEVDKNDHAKIDEARRKFQKLKSNQFYFLMKINRKLFVSQETMVYQSVLEKSTADADRYHIKEIRTPASNDEISIYELIKGSDEGIKMLEIKEKAAIKPNRVQYIVQRLFEQDQIERVSRGVYTIKKTST
jgi:hypothetical protein